MQGQRAAAAAPLSSANDKCDREYVRYDLSRYNLIRLDVTGIGDNA